MYENYWAKLPPKDFLKNNIINKSSKNGRPKDVYKTFFIGLTLMALEPEIKH